MADGVGLRYTINRDTLSPALAALLAGVADMTDVMDEIGLQLVSNVIDRFERETGPDGQEWKASARATAEGGKTLTMRGHLRASVTHIPGTHSVEWGSNLIYARIHQLGGKIEAKNGGALRFPIGDGFATVKSVTIPARPYLGFDDGDQADVTETLTDYLSGLAGGGAGATP
ncbi:MAG: phage virion morphogenesis protein [Pusillimonas sp.]|jgi:phage virion morphogenesis protein|nr:phage virion morphogenesis protein [Pusillimonas sp.]|tara:strand:- start:17059 stop:17574 length:516 start_codon:yes stop_codon:yes gene_type:complete